MTLAAGRTLAAGAGLAAAVYGLWVRPRLMRWGATDNEATGPYPGALDGDTLGVAGRHPAGDVVTR